MMNVIVKRLSIVYVIVTLLLASCANAQKPIKVEIKKGETGFTLYRDGKPYTIKGAGIEVSDFDAFVKHGGNSIRNWTTTNDKESTLSILDSAHAKGLTVSLCLPMSKEH